MDSSKISPEFKRIHSQVFVCNRVLDQERTGKGNMGKITINEEYCKGCGLCINFCPQKLIRTANHISKSGYHAAELCDPGAKCTGCAVCAMVCPDVAITVYREKKSVGEKK